MLYYDFHIHSVLSPCGDNDMTPNNIVNMAAICGLDAIAVTDHNSVGNVRAAIAAGKKTGVAVIPGMEVETEEEVHILTLYPSPEAAEEAAKEVYKALPDIKNRPEIFGDQLYMDENDEIIGTEEKLLVSATALSVYDIFGLAQKFGGIAVPAHIDRTSYSIISNLGFIPPDISAPALEITESGREKLMPDYPGRIILTNSDAHYLENIAERKYYLDLPRKNAQTVVDFLCINNQNIFL